MLIITGSDDNYVAGVLVLIASAAFHNPGARFAILDMGISVVNRARIDQLAQRLDCEINRMEVAPDAFDHLLIKRRHLTRSAYLRLLIPDSFPEENRALYMDCDMVVTDDLSSIWGVELGDAPIAAVRCPSPHDAELTATGHTRESYINSGLLLMNLPVWRRERISEKCVRLLSDPEKPLLSEDQSAINIVCLNRTIILPDRFNVYADLTAYKCLTSMPKKFAVIHYVVSNKPWNGNVTLGEIWHFHSKRIASLMPPLHKITLRRRVSIWNRRLKMSLGVAFRIEKYLLRQQVADVMNYGFRDSYLRRAANN